jgi:hypothetical protein
MPVGVSETQTCLGWRPDMSGQALWNPTWELDKSGSEDLTWVKAERPEMSEKTLFNSDKKPDKVGWDLAIEELGLGRICPI